MSSAPRLIRRPKDERVPRIGDLRSHTRSSSAALLREMARIEAMRCGTADTCNTARLFGKVPHGSVLRFVDPVDPDGRINVLISQATRHWLRMVQVKRGRK